MAVAGKYIELYYHLVWATKNREPLISVDLEAKLYDHLRRSCVDMKVFLYALNGMPDHVHVVCSVPPTLSISATVKQLKGASARLLNGEHTWFAWQPGYAALTFAGRDLRMVQDYVDRQKQHHGANTLHARLEATPVASDRCAKDAEYVR